MSSTNVNYQLTPYFEYYNRYFLIVIFDILIISSKLRPEEDFFLNGTIREQHFLRKKATLMYSVAKIVQFFKPIKTAQY